MTLLIIAYIAQAISTLLRAIQITITEEIQMVVIYCAASVTAMIALAVFNLWWAIMLVAIVQFTIFGYKTYTVSKYGYPEPEKYVY